MKHDLVIFGIGNLLMGDDGVGVHAARLLASAPPPGAEVVDAGTDFLSALPYLQNARRVLVIDAVRGGGAPGTLYHLTENDLAPQHDRSAHATSLLAARNLLAPGASAEVRILGVEPDVLGYGMELSPAVAAAVPLVVAQARTLAMEWKSEPCVNV